MQSIDLHPSAFIVSEVRQIQQTIDEQKYNFHAIMTRFNGRIDYINLQQNSTIITSNYAPKLRLLKSIPVYSDNQLQILCLSADLPNQLLVFDPYQIYALRTITLNFGDVTDIAVIQDDIVVITFYQGTVVSYKYGARSNQLQQLSYIQTGYKNIRHIAINSNSMKQYQNKRVLEFSAVQKEYMFIFNMGLDGMNLVKHSQYRHNSWINTTGFIEEYLLVGDQNNKLTLMDQTFNTNYVFNSRMSITNIHCTNEQLYLCSSSTLVIFKHNIGQSKRVRLTDLLKTQQAPFDIIGVCEYDGIITYYNQLGQFFLTTKSQVSVNTIFQFNSMVNDAFISPLDQNTLIYQSQNGLDVYDFQNNKIMLRLEMDNMLLQFNQMVSQHSTQQDNVQQDRSKHSGINSNFIADVNLNVIDEQNAILIISDYYNNETKFLLLNKTGEQYIVANLFQEDDSDNSSMTTIPACIKILALEKYVYCLFFQEYIVIVTLDVDNYFLPSFQRIQNLPETNITSQFNICVSQGPTDNSKYVYLAYFTQQHKNVIIKLDINYNNKYAIQVQNSLETQSISSLYLLNDQIVTTQNSLVVYDKDLHYVKQIDITIDNTPLRKIIGVAKNLLITYKKYYKFSDDGTKLEIVAPEVKHLYKTLLISENLKCYFYEQEVYGQFYYIATRVNDLTKFGKMQ